jgi:hypothetical protein
MENQKKSDKHPLIDVAVRITWKDEGNDWEYFRVLYIGDGIIRLRGMNTPTSIKHEGSTFWANLSDIDTIEELHG